MLVLVLRGDLWCLFLPGEFDLVTPELIHTFSLSAMSRAGQGQIHETPLQLQTGTIFQSREKARHLSITRNFDLPFLNIIIIHLGFLLLIIIRN